MCSTGTQLRFPSVSGCEVVARFDGGDLTSDAGLLLVGQADRQMGLVDAMSAAMHDRRDPRRVRHTLEDLVRERVLAIAAGYEDANDLDALREDPGLKLACGKAPQAHGVLCSQPTMSRLENGVRRGELLRMGQAIAQRVVASLPAHTRSVVIDVDATPDPCHGEQEGEHFNAHYDCHCYLPLDFYLTGPDGRQRLVASVLRAGNACYRVGLFSVLRRLVAMLRARFAGVRILLRADSGFGYADVMAFCEDKGMHYALGLAANCRLRALSTPMEMDTAIKHSLRWDDTPEHGEVLYKAHSWPKARRVVVKVEVTQDKLNPRYVVTDLTGTPKGIYRFYCLRGDRENRIKEMKNDLSSGRTSCHRFSANQCRLLWHTAACVLMGVLQEAAGATQWAKAQVGTLRVRLVKVAARIVQGLKHIWVHLPASYPDREAWRHLHRQLCPAG